MSLINKMLQDLDKRHAPQAGQASTSPLASTLASNLRPVKAARVGSELFWWAMAGVMLLAIAWLAWVMWQLTPRPVVNELALRTPSRVAAPSVASLPPESSGPPAASGSQAENVQPPSSPVVESMPVQVPAPAPAEVTRPPVAAAPAPPPKLDMLKLATEIRTPITMRAPRAAVQAAAPARTPAAIPGPAAPSAAKSVATVMAEDSAKAPARTPATAQAMARVAPVVPGVATASTEGRIDKRVSATTRERAESEYRRAVGLVNQGRMSEGMEGLRAALAADASYDAARQTLVALLVEQRRLDEAVVLLQRGLDLDPTNTGFAMLAARILVDRQDVAGALTLLRKYTPAAGGNADYHAFIAALQQRLGNHKDAIEEYQMALRLSPQSGMWWVGLGISQEASGHKKEAAEAFRRARTSGNLGGDLLAYVDQRLRQLQ